METPQHDSTSPSMFLAVCGSCGRRCFAPTFAQARQAVTRHIRLWHQPDVVAWRRLAEPTKAN